MQSESVNNPIAAQPVTGPQAASEESPPPKDASQSWPRSVGVLAIIGVCFGAIGLLWVPLSRYVLLFEPGVFHPFISFVRSDAQLTNWLVLSSVPAMLGMLILLVSSIGLWYQKRWGRRFMIYFALLEIALVVWGDIALARLLLDTEDFSPLRFGVPYLLLQLIFPLLVLHVLTRPQVKAAFRSPIRPHGGAHGFPVQSSTGQATAGA